MNLPSVSSLVEAAFDASMSGRLVDICWRMSTSFVICWPYIFAWFPEAKKPLNLEHPKMIENLSKISSSPWSRLGSPEKWPSKIWGSILHPWSRLESREKLPWKIWGYILNPLEPNWKSRKTTIKNQGFHFEPSEPTWKSNTNAPENLDFSALRGSRGCQNIVSTIHLIFACCCYFETAQV